MPNHDGTSHDANPALVDLLHAHGYACTVQDDWIAPTGFQTAVCLQATAWPVQHSTCVVSRLNVGVASCMNALVMWGRT